MMFLSLANLAKDAMNVYNSAKKAPNKYFNNQPGNYGYPNQQQYNGYPNQQQYNGYPNQQQYNGFPNQQQYNGYPNQPGNYGYPNQPGNYGYPHQQHAHLDSMNQEYNAYMDQPPIEKQNPHAHPYQMHYGGHLGMPPQTNNFYNQSPYNKTNVPPYNMRENEISKLPKQYINGSLKYRDAHEYYINKIKKFLFKKI